MHDIFVCSWRRAAYDKRGIQDDGRSEGDGDGEKLGGKNMWPVLTKAFWLRDTLACPCRVRVAALHYKGHVKYLD